MTFKQHLAAWVIGLGVGGAAAVVAWLGPARTAVLFMGAMAVALGYAVVVAAGS